ncbi:uncharacterized protein PHACADRAFT_260214 [Phanerochaete carnosa HHB-10118-sp]|uniref:Uncharacterized protein n=1 Tax=Phanerochaete carnosa (strain HHB-10118-sp) TaxID=650164 RepID=K5W3M0_PHACS|nr:uncharacterized protein PHACADRAFT_260214 [Phanerochaete carnosa HHB-10118-sp]EKM53725.1 hypothetical protein PHACADRAFT_260214 [Phanerochaete carnosa HHB-10118-sp]
MDVGELLKTLNDVFGTNHPLGAPGLQKCLEHFLRTPPDFGEVYGLLRGYWQSDFSQLLSTIARKRAHDEKMRQDVLHGDYIRNSNMRPRRVWDLYSNRVLPFFTLPPHSCKDIPDNVWTVSHSWVHGDALVKVSTPINGKQ